MRPVGNLSLARRRPSHPSRRRFRVTEIYLCQNLMKSLVHLVKYKGAIKFQENQIGEIPQRRPLLTLKCYAQKIAMSGSLARNSNSCCSSATRCLPRTSRSICATARHPYDRVGAEQEGDSQCQATHREHPEPRGNQEPGGHGAVQGGRPERILHLFNYNQETRPAL